MNPEELEQSWATLKSPPTRDGINGKRAPGLPKDRIVYLAVDGQLRRHLLLQLPDNAAPVAQRETRSLEVLTGRYQVGSNPEALFVDLVCTDPNQIHTFSAIAQDVIRSLFQTRESARDVILAVLARWRAFWAVKADGLSREEALGLFGELWFLRRWIGKLNAERITRWQATEGARHDFQWPLLSVEVKTASTQTSSAPTHRIGSLEQLADPERGKLFLFSLQVCDDALASNTLHGLVSTIQTDLQSDFHALNEFTLKLAARGYTPSDQNAASRPYRVLAERLYCIEDTFPRLTRAVMKLPAGITKVEYLLDLTACERWLKAERPDQVIQLLK